MNTGRGALSAISMWASTGISFHLPAHFCKLPANCQGKFCAMSSTVSPQSRRASAAPISPEQLENAAAIRSSFAVAHNAVFPRREWPKSAICLAFTDRSVSK